MTVEIIDMAVAVAMAMHIRVYRSISDSHSDIIFGIDRQVASSGKLVKFSRTARRGETY